MAQSPLIATLATAALSVVTATACPALANTGQVGSGRCETRLLPDPVSFQVLGPDALSKIWEVLGDPIVQKMSHDRFTKEQLKEDLNGPYTTYIGVYSGGELAGVAQAYNTRPGPHSVAKVENLMKSVAPRWKFVGLGLHFRPNFIGKGLARTATEHLIQRAFQDPDVGVVWAAAHRENENSRQALKRFLGEALLQPGEYNDYYYFMMSEKQYREREAQP